MKYRKKDYKKFSTFHIILDNVFYITVPALYDENIQYVKDNKIDLDKLRFSCKRNKYYRKESLVVYNDLEKLLKSISYSKVKVIEGSDYTYGIEIYFTPMFPSSKIYIIDKYINFYSIVNIPIDIWLIRICNILKLQGGVYKYNLNELQFPHLNEFLFDKYIEILKERTKDIKICSIENKIIIAKEVMNIYRNDIKKLSLLV